MSDPLDPAPQGDVSAARSNLPDAATFQRYAEAVRSLLDHGGFERTGDVTQAKKWDFDHITRWLDAHGRPDRRRTVHVAGSKGKGSVASMTAAILRAAGARTLLMTSPDMHGANERIQVDGVPLAYDNFAEVARVLLDDPDAAGWSYFEMLTVMGWLAGERAECDWQVVEVGLGGRLDTTNALAEKQVAVVTPIDLEHVAILGDSIPAIAREKAGIITGPCDVVVPPMRASAIDVIRERARDVGATLHEVTEECAMTVQSRNLDGQQLDIRTPLRTYRRVETAVIAPYQAENLVTAVRAAELAWASTGNELPEVAVREALRRFRMPGRFELISRRPLVLVDGLHTPLAARRFVEGVKALPFPAHRVWVFGVLGDKAVEELAGTLFGPGDEVIVVPVASARGADLAQVHGAVLATGAIAQRAPSVEAGLDRAIVSVRERGAVFVVGSLYVAAAAREHLLGIVGDRMMGLR